MARLSLWPLLLASLVPIPTASAGEESGEFDPRQNGEGRYGGLKRCLLMECGSLLPHFVGV